MRQDEGSHSWGDAFEDGVQVRVGSSLQVTRVGKTLMTACTLLRRFRVCAGEGNGLYMLSAQRRADGEF